MSDLAIIIVNYRTAALTVDCLRSLEADGYAPSHGRVIVVDNASGDDSCEVIGRAITANGWSGWVKLVPAERNGGFAYGNNVGIAQCGVGERGGRGRGGDRQNERIPPSCHPPLPPSSTPDYVLLLNPDTVVRPGAVEALVRFMETHPAAGICGGRLLDAEGRTPCSGFRFPSVLGELESGAKLGLLTGMLRQWVVPLPPSETPRLVGWVSGACFLVRRDAIKQMGHLDEAYFMYYEEVDFCRRATAAGWEVWHVPTAEIVHLEGAASRINTSRAPRPKYWYDSRRRYFAKTHGRWYAIAAEAAFLIGYATWRARTCLMGKANHEPERRMLDGFQYAMMPNLLARNVSD